MFQPDVKDRTIRALALGVPGEAIRNLLLQYDAKKVGDLRLRDLHLYARALTQLVTKASAAPLPTLFTLHSPFKVGDLVRMRWDAPNMSPWKIREVVPIYYLAGSDTMFKADDLSPIADLGEDLL